MPVEIHELVIRGRVADQPEGSNANQDRQKQQAAEQQNQCSPVPNRVQQAAERIQENIRRRNER